MVGDFNYMNRIFLFLLFFFIVTTLINCGGGGGGGGSSSSFTTAEYTNQYGLGNISASAHTTEDTMVTEVK